MEEKKTILDVKHLRVDFTTDQGTVQAVRDVSFSVKEGEILGIVGESGLMVSQLQERIFLIIVPMRKKCVRFAEIQWQ